MGIAAISAQDSLDAEEASAVSSMEESAGFITDALNEMLLVDTLENNEMKLIVTDFCLRDLIEMSVYTASEAARIKNVKICTRLSDSTCLRVKGDQLRLQSVLSSILTNATKLSHPGQSIDISVASLEPKSESSRESSSWLGYFKKLGSNFSGSRFYTRAAIAQYPSLIWHRLCIITVTCGQCSSGDDFVGITDIDIDEQFLPLHSLLTKERDKRSVNLTSAREIIRLHGGSLECKLMEDGACVFTIRIDFDCCDPGDEDDEQHGN
jgi:hypothetical protein